ncbi:DUF1287 domain-containing protein [Lysobacter sp. BMK333-48F3]|uniref:DUF1287 domain-containing protein n=1 Tax=Lysobacter sp. BMK333-48F3 TaxID=2867962 RepID=UPI001C8C72D4|nr:DUF1287 domain-containing protein [Lysobacter sp. BMK333-48F3]MBX9401932.1 DUF1287 domain-containing protein [Lysobacter sp. BMK333-48F3]
MHPPRHGRRRLAQRQRRSPAGAAALLAVALLAACSRDPAPPPGRRVEVRVQPAPASAATEPAPPWVAAARAQIGVTRYYDPAYVRLAYPGGDVAADRGVCTDVVIRALRSQGLDLQQAVHEDMRADFAAYPKLWGAAGTDRSIDHRRVPNLRRWFERQRWSRPPSERAGDYRAGDLVTWTLPGGLPHIGIVSERRGWSGRPLILHNIARGTQEEDLLFAYPISGHYRPRPQDIAAWARRADAGAQTAAAAQ